MTVRDEFLFQRIVAAESDESVVTRRCDLSLITDSDDKIEKTVAAAVGFLIQSGFPGDDLLDCIDDFLDHAKAHPDNNDFSIESTVEDHLKDEKMYKDFIENIRYSIEHDDTDLLKELFRRWLMIGYYEHKIVPPTKAGN